MICNSCNHTIPDDSEFCSYCGNIIKKKLEKPEKSNVEKGFAYLELKQWDRANTFFEASVVDGADKASAYIGRLLSKLHLTELFDLATVNKSLLKFDDFKMALKYADSEYNEQLNKCLEQNDNYLNEKKFKRKKKTTVLCISLFCVVVLAALSYFVFVPYGKIAYYKNQLVKGRAQEAANAYASSKWLFEYDDNAQKLFYEFGVDFAENENYKEAVACFATLKNYKDSKNHYNYCKGRTLLNNEDLDSYNYFIKCRGFLDTDEVLSTNKYLSQLEILQGEWYHPTIKKWKSEAEWRSYMRSQGYIEDDGEFFDPNYYDPEFVGNGNGQLRPGQILSSHKEVYERAIINISGNLINNKLEIIIEEGKLQTDSETAGFRIEGENLISIISKNKILYWKEYISGKVTDIEWTRVK